MNWLAVAAISETIGVIALVISLLYLAFQVRFARLAAADTSRTARANGIREIDLAMVNNPELRDNRIDLLHRMPTRVDCSLSVCPAGAPLEDRFRRAHAPQSGPV